MVELSTRRSLVEPLSTNTDAVRDAVNPLKGLPDVSAGLEKAYKVLSDMRQDHILSDAYVGFSTLSASSGKDYNDFINSVNTRDVSKIDGHVNNFIDGTLRKRYDNFLSSIPDKQIRQYFRQHMEHDLLGYKKKGLELKIGATVRAQEEAVNLITNNASDNISLDPSNNNHVKQLSILENYINSLPLDIEQKQKVFNAKKEDLHKTQVISAYKKNPRQFENFITVSYKNGSSSKGSTSLASLVDSAGDRETVVNEDLSKSIELDGWNRLGNSERRILLEHLINKDNAANTLGARELRTTLKTHSALFLQGKRPDEAEEVNLDQCMRMFGAEKGAEAYYNYKFEYELAPEIAKIKTMTGTEAKNVLETIADQINDPNLSSESMLKYTKVHQILSKAHTQSMEELHKDPIKWGIKYKNIDPLRFDTSENLVHSLAQRPSFVRKIKATHGIVSPHLNAEEARLFKDQLMRSPAHETVQLYQQAYQLLPDSDKAAMETAFAKQDDHVLATIARLSMKEDQPRLAQTVVIGAKHKSEIEKDFKVNPGSNNESFDSHYNPLIASYLSPLKHNSAGACFERASEAVKLYILGNMKQTNDYTIDPRVVEKAVKEVLGNNIVSVNGCSLMPPRGMKEEEFMDRLWFLTKSAGEFNPGWGHYANIGDGLYSLVEHGHTKIDKDGNPIVINIRDARADKFMKERKERINQMNLRIWEGQVFYD